MDDLPRESSDVDWASTVASRGWVAVTRDKRIRYRSAEKQAIADGGLGLFVLASRRNLSRQEIVDAVSAAAPRMAECMAVNEPPFIASIYRDGKISLKEKL